MKIFLDIETIPTQRDDVKDVISGGVTPPKTLKKQETIDRWYETEYQNAIDNEISKTGLNGAFGEIFSIALAIDDEQPVVFYRENWQSETRERDVLNDVFNYIEQRYSPQDQPLPIFIGHNIYGFDLPFIHQRCIINNITIPHYLPKHTFFYGHRMYDTMIEFSGRQNKISMNNLCLALGIAGKTDEIDGSKVWDFVKSGRIDLVVKYNVADVERTREIYKRIATAECL